MVMLVLAEQQQRDGAVAVMVAIIIGKRLTLDVIYKSIPMASKGFHTHSMFDECAMQVYLVELYSTVLCVATHIYTYIHFHNNLFGALKIHVAAHICKLFY